MALKTFVKVSGINNLSDARYCAGMGVNQLGFNIEPKHSNYTDPDSFKEVADWISGVDFVGEIESLDAQDPMKELITQYSIQSIQVSQIALIPEALSNNKPVIFYTTHLEEAERAADLYAEKLDYILLEDENASLSDVKALSDQIDVVVGANLSVETLDQLLSDVQPKGIGLKGGDEIRPGYKDFDELADILEALDADEFA